MARNIPQQVRLFAWVETQLLQTVDFAWFLIDTGYKTNCKEIYARLQLNKLLNVYEQEIRNRYVFIYAVGLCSDLYGFSCNGFYAWENNLSSYLLINGCNP